MEKKKTAVEWFGIEMGKLFAQYHGKIICIGEFHQKRFELEEQALQMEQNQIEDVAMYHKDNDATLDCIRSYVKKNYKSNTDKKVLAVLYLYEEIDRAVFNFLEGITTRLELSVEIRHAKNKALQMEREQMEKAVSNGISKADMIDNRGYFNFDKWYNETYGGQDNEQQKQK